jgi:hypothetical protein
VSRSPWKTMVGTGTPAFAIAPGALPCRLPQHSKIGEGV